MAYFGQGAQLIALPHDQGVALNLVAKEPAEVNVPWKEEYIYKRVLGPEFFAVLFIWMLGILLLPGEGWSTADTVVTCFAVFLVLMFFMVRHPRLVAAAFASIADFVMGVIG